MAVFATINNRSVVRLATAVALSLLSSCTSDFTPLNLSSSAPGGLSLDGKALYSAKCSSCHGELASSTKLDRTEFQVTQALQSIPSMTSLQLSPAEISAITTALNGQSGLTQVFTCSDPNARGITADRMRKLTLTQLKNTLRDLLGTTIANDSDFKQKLASIPDDTLQVSVGEVNDNPSLYHARALYDASARAIAMMDANTQLRAAVLGSCTVSSLDEACVRSVISQFGKRVLRRPPTSTETTDYVAFYNSMGGGVEGLNYLFARLLQNPTMVFHIEDGSSPSSGRYRLTDFEIASRISYMTANTMPDDALLIAASKGELQNIVNVRSHVERFLAKQDGVTKAQDFVRYYTRLRDLMPNPKAAANSGVSTSGLAAEAKQEFFDFVNHTFFSTTGTFANLLTSPAAFPRTANLAKVLDASVVSATQPVSNSPTHPGLLHRPAFLLSAGDRTSPILRGALIRKFVLCDTLGDPPADAVAAREDEVGDLSLLSNREGSDHLTSPTACASCHSAINKLGYPFEKYNQLGGLRTTEPIFDAQGNVIRTFPINTAVSDPKIESGGPSAFNDSTELVTALARSTKAKACYSRKIFEYYAMRPVDMQKDGCALAVTEQEIGSRDLRTVLIDSIANEDIFWRKQP